MVKSLQNIIINCMPVREEEKTQLFQELDAINQFVENRQPLTMELINQYTIKRSQILANHNQLSPHSYGFARRIVRDLQQK